jgi:uncharacterized protein
MAGWTWDPNKDRRNRLKHRVGLAVEPLVLADPLAISVPDSSQEEERWRTVGSVGGSAVLLVVHTAPVETAPGFEVGRIISVRKATPRVRRAYEEGKGAFG